MLLCQGIHKSYDSLHVLKGIDLSVETGEIVSVTGESGAGKSTLLHILGTLDMPDKGKVVFNGEDLTNLPARKLSQFRNRNLGFVFQFHQLLPEFTALENVCIPGWISGRPKKEVQQQAMELLDYLGLAERATHKPAQISGGEQQRVAVARALINRPALVMADEPSGNLDSKNAKMLHDYFLKLRTDFGLTFIIVTHNPELAEMADRNIRLRDGQILQ